jgi:hypothetical protein
MKTMGPFVVLLVRLEALDEVMCLFIVLQFSNQWSKKLLNLE